MAFHSHTAVQVVLSSLCMHQNHIELSNDVISSHVTHWPVFWDCNDSQPDWHDIIKSRPASASVSMWFVLLYTTVHPKNEW